MTLTKSIQMMFVTTVLGLIYTHMQMHIFDLAYQGKKKEKAINDLIEYNNIMSYNIHRLKSSNYLGINLLTEDSNLKFQDNEHVVQLVTAELSPEEELPSISPQNQTNPLVSFLSLKIPQAEARDAKKEKEYKPWRRGY